MKNLFFLWFPDPATMPAFEQANVARWRELNPTWNVHVWSIAEVREFIRAFAVVEVLHVFDYLVKVAQAEADPRPIWGKVSDLVRIIVLHYQPGEWNAYSDSDNEPLRSLDDFMTGTQWPEHATGQVGGFQMPAMRDIDWGGPKPLSVLFSGENRNNRNPTRLSVNNNFMLAKPGTALMEKLIRFCLPRKEEIVLKAFGPWALTAFLAEIRDRFRMNGFAIIPFSVSNFIAKELNNATPPPYCLCVHHQKMSWTGEGEDGWLGGGKLKRVKLV